MKVKVLAKLETTKPMATRDSQLSIVRLIAILSTFAGTHLCAPSAHAVDLGLPLVEVTSDVPLCNDVGNHCTGATYTTGISSPIGDEPRVFKYYVHKEMINAPIVVILHGGVSSFPYENTLLEAGSQPAFLGRLASEFANTAFVAIRGNASTSTAGQTGHRYVRVEADKYDSETYRDVKFIRQVIQDMRDTFAGYVSPNQEYLVGFSAGAGLVESVMCVDGVGYEGFAIMGLPLGEVRAVDCGNTQSHEGYTTLTGSEPKKYGALSGPLDDAIIRRGKIYYYIGLADERINKYDTDASFSQGLLKMAQKLTNMNGLTRAHTDRILDSEADGFITEVREYSTPANGQLARGIRKVRIAFTDNSDPGFYDTRAGRAFSNSAFPESTMGCVNVTPPCTPQELGLVQYGGGHNVPDERGNGTIDFNIVDEFADFFGWN